MTTVPTTSSVVRSILTANLNLTADEVIQKAIRQGVTAPPKSIRALVYNIRGELKGTAVRRNGTAKAAPVVKAIPPARPTATAPMKAPTPRIVPTPTKAVAAPISKPQPVPATAVAGVLANVALVNRVVGLCGGPENVRQAAEAVRACGGVDEFLQHLELVAGITAGKLAG